MYAEDSFFTLSLLGRIGLVALSIGLVIVTAAVVRRVTTRWPPLAGILLALIAFWLFLWLSPQIYYLYYMTLFEGLPLQSVVRHPSAPSTILNLLIFQERPTLAAHGQGVMGWLLMIAAVWPRRRQPVQADEPAAGPDQR